MISDHLQDARVLLVDDEPDHLRVLEGLLHHFGLRATVSTQDPTEAAEISQGLAPDLVILDLHMPGRDGFRVLADLHASTPESDFLPILVLTADPDPEVRRRALALGARDFLHKPFDATEVLLRVKNLLETRYLHRELRRNNESLETKVKERTYELAEAQVEILRRLAVTAEYRDDVTGRHAERVGLLSALLAAELGLHPEEVQLLRRAAPLHDVGKIGIPDAILRKPGALTHDEFEVVKRHTKIGARILSGSEYPLLEVARIIAETHHEHWNGNGYGKGLAGESIPLVGRIVAVADVFDSLTQPRTYKEAFPIPTAIDTVRRKRSTHFDPRIVDAFEALVAQGVLEELEGLTGGPSSPPPLAAARVRDRAATV